MAYPKMKTTLCQGCGHHYAAADLDDHACSRHQEPIESVACAVGECRYCGTAGCVCPCHPRRRPRREAP